MVESRYETVIDNILKPLKESDWTEFKDIYTRTRLTRTELIFILYILEREKLITYKKHREKIKINKKGLNYLKLPKNTGNTIKN